MKKLILLISIALPSFALAAEVGQYFSPTGDTVTVTLSRSGNYRVHVETSHGQSTCTFDNETHEVEEGDMRFSEAGCSLRAFQANERTISISARGCSEYCEAGANLRITRATKE